MANPSKAKGTRAETKVANYLNDHDLPTKRKALAGSEDPGDLCMILPDGTEVAVEVKTGKQTQNFPRSRLDRWKFETLVEAHNAKCNKGMLVVVRYRRAFVDSEVWLPNGQWYGHDGWTMMYLDEFVRRIGG